MRVGCTLFNALVTSITGNTKKRVIPFPRFLIFWQKIFKEASKSPFLSKQPPKNTLILTSR
ncbi:hypothetical protein DCM91_13415 [Chitinophaga costaii]|nr:hypothetical protein DCM91_13415 [Chitinophaga costaii]